ncbi:hypothetical protein J5X98_10820 [Leptothermofonsia sichuanensis E412]|uniref:hypothetical protein n=1 Tax=Leptothermofonsia sichuanensis TaxID=2917832 RepID=UPI001CA77693|nr:hypothetical protein [Leptothermofonsia sichuanensis]QZZ22794.1 hypothetical protein J5X98_10820 [Leptothermofonsia sichuanensis E412]
MLTLPGLGCEYGSSLCGKRLHQIKVLEARDATFIATVRSVNVAIVMVYSPFQECEVQWGAEHPTVLHTPVLYSIEKRYKEWEIG